jgi:predicted glycoside hydrolase/deacetylase ChbG (UPF0249 family)
MALLALGMPLGAQAQEKDRAGGLRLLVRADDMGACHAINEACIRAYREGIARSAEVIVPGPWFLDAVRLLGENPGLDVGVHLCLTSEWERCRWGPLTRGASLVDADGYFFPMTSQQKGFPPNTGFLEAKPRMDEVERELRAQIERARKHLPGITHLSTHMGAAASTPELKELTLRLAKEYKLRLEFPPGAKHLGGWSGNRRSAQEKEEALAGALEKLQPGTWILVEHPGLDVPEMRALGHRGYENVAADREGVTRALTSDRVKAVLKARGIELVSYADLKEE